MRDNLNNKRKLNTPERVFVVNESYADKRNLSDIFAELLYSAYCKNESETGKGLNLNGYLPSQDGQPQYENRAC